MVDTNYAEPKKGYKPKLKKFNLNEEEIKHGWKLAKEAAFKVGKFEFLEGMWVFLTTCAVLGLGYYNGFWNINDLSILQAIPLIALPAIIIFAETIFHFGFLFKKIDKPDFWSFTFPYKAISYVAGILAVFVAPLSTILGTAIVPYYLNHEYAKYVARRNFNRRAQHYVPEAFEEPGYEDPKNGDDRPKVPPQRVPTKLPPGMREPTISVMDDAENARIYSAPPQDNMVLNLSDVKKAVDFINRQF